MNFDGQALVVNQEIEVYYSENGSAVVASNSSQVFNYYLGEAQMDRVDFIFNAIEWVGDARVFPQTVKYNRLTTIPNIVTETAKVTNHSKVPFTAQVYKRGQNVWKTTTFSPKTAYVLGENDRSKICELETRVQIHDKTSRYEHDEYDFAYSVIHDVAIPTNLYIFNESVAYIIDCVRTSDSKSFSSVSANIIDKTEIVIPSPVKGYQDMFLVVQKNHFIELKLSDTIIDVTGLPDGLDYSLNAIKGIIEKSGSYDIRIQYQESSQKLNIIVPYYERTL